MTKIPSDRLIDRWVMVHITLFTNYYLLKLLGKIVSCNVTYVDLEKFWHNLLSVRHGQFCDLVDFVKQFIYI